MIEIPITKGATTIVDEDDYSKISKYKWSYLIPILKAV